MGGEDVGSANEGGMAATRVDLAAPPKVVGAGGLVMVGVIGVKAKLASSSSIGAKI